MTRKQTLNEEQEAQGRKDLGVYGGMIFAVSPKTPPWEQKKPEASTTQVSGTEPQPNGHSTARIEFIESERFFDARAFAIRLFGVPEVSVARVDESPSPPLPRWQIRWEGTCGSHSNPLRLQRRKLHAGQDPKTLPWTDDR